MAKNGAKRSLPFPVKGESSEKNAICRGKFEIGITGNGQSG
jgi:hypothetical protein